MDELKAFLDTFERDQYGEEEYEMRHTPQTCVFVRPDGRMLFARVAVPADIDREEYEGEIYSIVREELVSGEFLDGKRNIKTFFRSLLEAGVSAEELRSIMNDLTERKKSDGTPRRDNRSHVAYKQPVERKEGIFAFVIE